MKESRILSLRSILLVETGQDLRRCQGCMDCDVIPAKDVDISLGSLVQMALLNDEEILTSRTIWSDFMLESAQSACAKHLDLAKIILALRREAIKRGFVECSLQ